MSSKKFLPILIGLTVGSQGFAQALSSLSLSLEKAKTTLSQTGDSVTSLDLLNEARRQSPALRNLQQIDLSRVELLIKSGLGGANAYLMVNREYVDSAVVETNPDDFQGAGPGALVELKNIERRVETANLQVVGPVRLSSVTLFFGAISEPTILGSYLSRDAQMVAAPSSQSAIAEGSRVIPPGHLAPGAALTVATEAGPSPAQASVPAPVQSPMVAAPRTLPPAVASTASVSAPVVSQVVARPVKIEPTCVDGFCVGDSVLNNFGFEGTVLRVFPQERLLEIQFSFSGKPTLRETSKVRRK